MIKYLGILFIFCVLTASCSSTKKAMDHNNNTGVEKSNSVSVKSTVTHPKTFIKPLQIDRAEFVSFAKTLLGTPYKYASAIPQNGLDCSGFITAVFNHFNVKAPRTAVSFTDEGTTIDIKKSIPGDIILFTGSDNSTGVVGHMGIIILGGETPQFIHSASGKNIGVIINTFSGYYKTHFVKVIRILAP